MKASLGIKLFITVCLMFIFLILIVLFLNTTLLEKYYRQQKSQSLVNVFNEATSYFSDRTIDSTSDFILELQRIDTTKNIEVVVCDLDDNVLLFSSNNFLKNGLFVPRITGDGETEFSLDYMLNSLSDDVPYLIKSSNDRRFSSEFITLYGRLKSGYFIILRTPLESIRESVSISNRFLLLVGLFCTFLTSAITYFVSMTFTKPIRELCDIAERMSDLDFSKKYTVETDDEIGKLGMSINKLSASLEKTIKSLKETNMELEKDVEETSKISEMRNQFISDVSHELKTPIALIQGYAEGLNDGIVEDEESKKHYIEVILDEANKMSNLTKDLLDLSRLEYGKEELKYEVFNITELAQNTMKKNELLFNEKEIKYELISEKDCKVKADHTRIEQVLTNYISNAIKNISGEKRIVCTIKETENGKIHVSVINTGNHIDEEDIPRLWTRFYKVDTSRNRSAGGTGIGLSLVKAIMVQHHNDYGVKNVENGVEFWFELDRSE